MFRLSKTENVFEYIEYAFGYTIFQKSFAISLADLWNTCKMTELAHEVSIYMYYFMLSHYDYDILYYMCHICV